MKTKAILQMVLSMIIFGTIGIITINISMPSAFVAMVRGLVGMLFLLAMMTLFGQKIDIESIRKNIRVLLLSGALLGFNWVLLFEAYKYTTVAIVTLCYYMQPIFLILGSPIILKEKINKRKIVCVLVALIGMVLISGVINRKTDDLYFSQVPTSIIGILLGLGAAILYAGVVFSNKILKKIGNTERTVVQLGTATVVLIPYVILKENIQIGMFSIQRIVLLLILGIVYTGIAYLLYFSSMKVLNTNTIGILSYLDPLTAVLISVTVLHQPLGLLEYIGAILVLGSAFLSEISLKRKLL